MEKVGTLNERDIQEQNKLQICRTLIAVNLEVIKVADKFM